MLKCIASVVAAAIILTGCASQKSQNFSDARQQSSVSQSKSGVQIKQALSRRGMERERGLINYINFSGQCADMTVRAHRGFVDAPENSLSAIELALLNGSAEVEIDVTRMNDGVWVLHHDSRTGRATAHPDGQHVLIRQLNKTTRKQILHRNTKTGHLTSNWIPTLEEAIEVFKQNRRPYQVLNIEIRGNYNHSALKVFEYHLFESLPKEAYILSSSDASTLRIFRSLNQDVRLNLIQNPNQRSLQILRDNYQATEHTTGTFIKRINLEEQWAGRGLKNYRRISYMDAFTDIFNFIGGGKIDLTIDARDFVLHAESLAVVARQLELRIAVYSVNGQEYLNHALLIAAKKPDVVQIDDTVYGFCKNYFLPARDTSQISLSGLAAQLDALPADVDLEYLEDITPLFSKGLYPSIKHGVISIKHQESIRLKTPERASRQKAESAYRPVYRPIIIKIEQDK